MVEDKPRTATTQITEEANRGRTETGRVESELHMMTRVSPNQTNEHTVLGVSQTRRNRVGRKLAIGKIIKFMDFTCYGI